MNDKYEIEIKSLLGEEKVAKALKEKIKDKFPDMSLVGRGKQLNHYFTGGIEGLYDSVSPVINQKHHDRLREILKEGKDPSIRSRETDLGVFFVVKASIDGGSSANTIKKLEFEEKVELTLSELDQLLLDAGLTYQAKWSRVREEYKCGDINVCFDKNAGYGFIAEFEKLVNDSSMADKTEAELRELMSQLGVEELDQNRLERMFEFYNKNWKDYYGTENIFVVE